jgi:hypothetical protein
MRRCISSDFDERAYLARQYFHGEEISSHYGHNAAASARADVFKLGRLAVATNLYRTDHSRRSTIHVLARAARGDRFGFAAIQFDNKTTLIFSENEQQRPGRRQPSTVPAEVIIGFEDRARVAFPVLTASSIHIAFAARLGAVGNAATGGVVLTNDEATRFLDASLLEYHRTSHRCRPCH